MSKLEIFLKTYKNTIINSKNKLDKIILCFDKKSNNLSKDDCDFILNPKVQRRMLHSFTSLVHVTKLTTDDTNLEGKSIFGYKYVNYWNGYSYQILYSKLIPRIFWKNKPKDNLGNEFGHRYSQLTRENKEKDLNKDNVTSWNMPVLNEFYVNYGFKGVISGMFLIGFLFGVISKLGTLPNNKNLELVVFFFLVTPIFFMESHLSLIFGAILQSYIFLIILSYILLIILRKFDITK